MTALFASYLAYRAVRPAVKPASKGTANLVVYTLVAPIVAAFVALLIVAGVALAVTYVISPKSASKVWRKINHRHYEAVAAAQSITRQKELVA